MALNISSHLTTDEWEAALGEQFRRMRILQNLQQVELAAKASVSVGAIKHLEDGHGSSLATVIKIARALGREDWLNALQPEIAISPMQMLKRQKRDANRKVYHPRATTDTK